MRPNTGLNCSTSFDHVPEAPLSKLRDVAHQITSMIIASIKTARQKQE